MNTTRNPFAVPAVVAGYERWYETTGRRADRLEKVLLGRLLGRLPGTREVLEVGCGTGHFTRWMTSRGLQVVGLDLSRPMLREAGRLGTRGCVEGSAIDLPFPDRSFDAVALITTLEFVEDPVAALAEALRVTRGGLILGVLNRRSRLGRRLKGEGGDVWGAANLFTPGELEQAVRDALAGRRADCFRRTTLWPHWPYALPLPWGGFIGMAVRLA